MAVAMVDYPMTGQAVMLSEVSDGMGFNQAINFLAFHQTHLLTSAEGDFSQDSPAAVDLNKHAVVIGDQGADLSLHLVLDGNA